MFNQKKDQYTLAVAGTTERTLQCAQAIALDPRFQITWVLTAAPKPIGRHQVVTLNPLAKWATQQEIPQVAVDKKITTETSQQLNQLPKPDILLVVDFGYLIPSWLLKLPNVAPLNLHPSLLPKWRGSSPGQFVLLAGEETSAITLMVMDEGLDTGPTLKQLSLPVKPDWTMPEYYNAAFGLACTHLADLVHEVVVGTLLPTPQPSDSPTPIARRLTREDGFVDLKLLRWVTASTPHQVTSAIPWGETAQLLQDATRWRSATPNRFDVAQTLECAGRAFFPWPGIWTIIDDRRVKLLALSLDKKNHLLHVKTFQREGKKPQSSGLFAHQES